jgi:hypothetical protein
MLRTIAPLTLVLTNLACAVVRAPQEPIEAKYQQRCGSCHEPFPAYAFSDRQWPGVVERMRSKAQLDARDRAAILEWLQTNN